MSISKTIVINCAGTGSRIGFGYSKTLLEVSSRSLIHHHLEQLKDFDDIRIVVGFESKKLIDEVLKFRRDVTFVFNHDYLKTETLASLFLGSKFAREYVVSVDGDLLISPADFASFLKEEGEVMGYIDAYSDEPVYVAVETRRNIKRITSFSRKSGKYEWTGLIQIKKEKLNPNFNHVYQLVEGFLPLRAKYVDCREIDTVGDYKRAIEWASIKLK